MARTKFDQDFILPIESWDCSNGLLARNTEETFQPLDVLNVGSWVGLQDSWLIDYTATKNTLEAGKNVGASHFVLLSGKSVFYPMSAFVYLCACECALARKELVNVHCTFLCGV